MQIAKKDGVVHWADIEPDMYFLNFDWGRAEGFNANSSEKRAKFTGMTMKDYLHYLWNNPKAGQSPYKLFGGVLVPVEFDGNGDVVYKYNPNVTHEPIKAENWQLRKL